MRNVSPRGMKVRIQLSLESLQSYTREKKERQREPANWSLERSQRELYLQGATGLDEIFICTVEVEREWGKGEREKKGRKRVVFDSWFMHAVLLFLFLWMDAFHLSFWHVSYWLGLLKGSQVAKRGGEACSRFINNTPNQIKGKANRSSFVLCNLSPLMNNTLNILHCRNMSPREMNMQHLHFFKRSWKLLYLSLTVTHICLNYIRIWAWQGRL